MKFILDTLDKTDVGQKYNGNQKINIGCTITLIDIDTSLCKYCQIDVVTSVLEITLALIEIDTNLCIYNHIQAFLFNWIHLVEFNIGYIDTLNCETRKQRTIERREEGERKERGELERQCISNITTSHVRYVISRPKLE